MAHELLDQCQWPPLAEPYNTALHEAVAFVSEHVQPRGIVACGSIIRGKPDATSDIDLYVVNSENWRQRVQRWFNGVPAEIFINPVSTIEGYFREEQDEARPSTAHMLSTGFVVYAADSSVADLVNQARQLMTQPPQASETGLLFSRYSIATIYEDALDKVERDPETATMLMNQAVYDMLNYTFRREGRFIPRYKELLDSLKSVDGELAVAARAYFAAPPLAERLALAATINSHTIAAQGFFEWETARQEMS